MNALEDKEAIRDLMTRSPFQSRRKPCKTGHVEGWPSG